MKHSCFQYLLILALLVLLVACAPLTVEPADELTPISPITATVSALSAGDPPEKFSGNLAFQHILVQEGLGPRPVGTVASQQTGYYIANQLQKWGWQVEIKKFIFKGIKGQNIVGKAGCGPVIILGAHYDTRPTADRDPDPAKRRDPIWGANDGGSGVAILLEIARVLDPNTSGQEVWLAFFDAEDKGLIDGWPFSVGSRAMASSLSLKPQAVVIIDMVGDTNQTIYIDHNSNRALSEEIWAVAAELGYGDSFISTPKYRIFDDHLPFIEQGITAIDIIDFDYPYWHTTADTADKISPESLERVGRTLITWLETK